MERSETGASLSACSGRDRARQSSGFAGMVGGVGNREGRPWPEWRDGKPITPRQLAALLRPYEIVPRTIRLDDDSTAKGYHLEAFAEAFDRYLPPEGGAPSVTTSQPNA